MSIALELRGISKRFVAGMGGCRIEVDVLRGVDLVVRSGECALVVGPRGSGKSTLLLCAVGWLTPDAGERRWFGGSSRTDLPERLLYHDARAQLARTGPADESCIHFVDIRGLSIDAPFVSWMTQRRARGDAVIVAAEQAGTLLASVNSVVALTTARQNRSDAHATRSRVAESARAARG